MVAQQHVFLLSDATGETAEKMVMAALTQFREKTDPAQADKQCANQEPGLRGA